MFPFPLSDRRSQLTMPKKVLIVGAGAAGTAAAYTMGKQPGEFTVEIWERGSVPGTVHTMIACMFASVRLVLHSKLFAFARQINITNAKSFLQRTKCQKCQIVINLFSADKE